MSNRVPASDLNLREVTDAEYEAERKFQIAKNRRRTVVVTIIDIVVSVIVIIIYIVYGFYGPAGWGMTAAAFILNGIAITAASFILVKKEAKWPIILWLVFGYSRIVFEICTTLAFMAYVGKRGAPILKSKMRKDVLEAHSWGKQVWGIAYFLGYCVLVVLAQVYCCLLTRKPRVRPAAAPWTDADSIAPPRSKSFDKRTLSFALPKFLHTPSTEEPAPPPSAKNQGSQSSSLI